MSTLVMKFGGTSVGSAEAIGQTVDIVQEYIQDWECLVVVVSAMSGATDALAQGAQAAASGDDQAYRAIVAGLRTRHHEVVDTLLDRGNEHIRLLATVDRYIDELAAFCYSIHILGEVTTRAMDAVTSLGERINARVVAAVLHQRGVRGKAVDATELIITDDKFQNAAPLMDATRARVSDRLSRELDDGIVLIVTGFIGATEEGVTTTLGRGGSDYTAAILGDCLDADEIWTWTDVDGVMTADPRIAPDARVIPQLSYSEVSELAYFGAKVLHPKTILPTIRRGIPLWVKNTFNPACPGTRIAREAESANGEVKAVTAIEGMSMVTVEGRGMMGVPGIAARTFSAVASQGASVLMISQASSEQSICFIIPTQTSPLVVSAIEEEMALELARRDVDRVWSLDDVVIVTIVGAGMRDASGIAARVFSALSRGNINIIAIAQGSSECSISLVVAADAATDAVRQIHTEVIIDGG